MMDDTVVKELLQFLDPTAQPHARNEALTYICGLSGTKDGRELFHEGLIGQLCTNLLNLMDDNNTSTEAVFLCLVNFSSDEKVANKLCDNEDAMNRFLKMVVNAEESNADPACMILSNITRNKLRCQRVMDLLNLGTDDTNLPKLVEVFCKEGYNPKAKLHFLGPVLANLSQLPEARKLFLDRERCVIQRLLPYTQYNSSATRRRAAITALKNCCFDIDYHEWLLSDAVDILPQLLLPLAGPEELTVEEMEGMPDDLQYLEEGKQREEEPEIRIMLLEAIMKLCTTTAGRKLVKEKKVYVILREFHKWEKVEAVLEVCENLIGILIGDEVGDLQNIDIPEDISKQLNETQSTSTQAET